MRRLLWAVAACGVLIWSSVAHGQELKVKGPLHTLSPQQLTTILPPHTHLMLDSASIEEFLHRLDDHPPDWQTVYGHGHHDSGQSDRLLALNRERDAKREGNPTLSWLLTFVWLGELSAFNSDSGGFSVALGPKFISTRWGIVRFKPEDAPGNLVVLADTQEQQVLQDEIDRRHHVDIEVVMTGRLVPQESLVYDFSHEEEGRGLIMPFVRVEQVDYVRLSSR